MLALARTCVMAPLLFDGMLAARLAGVASETACMQAFIVVCRGGSRNLDRATDLDRRRQRPDGLTMRHRHADLRSGLHGMRIGGLRQRAFDNWLTPWPGSGGGALTGRLHFWKCDCRAIGECG